MKKTFLSFFVSIFMLTVMAQTTLNTAVDFTVTDSKGVSHNLFSYLDAGKLVCLDFFYKDCPACATTAPHYQGAFEYFGCNQGNVIFIAISSRDSDATLISYAAEKGYTYPMVSSSSGGGVSVHSAYGVTATPTYILITPNRDIVEQDIYPVPSVQTFIDKIAPHGGIAQECVTSVNESSQAEFSIFPNPVENTLFVNAPCFQNLQFEVIDLLGKVVHQEEMNAPNGLFEINVSNLHKGVYFVRCISNSKVIGTKKVFKN